MGLYAYWKVTRRFNIMIIQGVKTSMEKNRLRPTANSGKQKHQNELMPDKKMFLEYAESYRKSRKIPTNGSLQMD